MFSRHTLNKRLLAATAMTLLVGQAATQADAAIIYGDFSDVPPGSVMYMDVTESSSSDPVPPPLYGAPSIAGNQLDFDPTGFGATAQGTLPGADVTEGQLNFDFSAVNDTGLKSLLIQEGGDFSLYSTGSALTTVSAGIFAQVDITELNGTTLANPITVTASTAFSADLAANPGLSQLWSQALLVDFGPALLNAGYDPSIYVATSGEVVINNTLIALSEANPNTIGQIVKKDFRITPTTGPVPEPGSIALLGVAATLVASRRRRR